MSQNMKTLLPNTKFYDFSRKFWQVTAYLELFGGHRGGGRNFTKGAAPPAPCWIRPCYRHPKFLMVPNCRRHGMVLIVTLTRSVAVSSSCPSNSVA